MAEADRQPTNPGPARFLLRLVRDCEGGAMLETVIVLPVVGLFMLMVMEFALMANARQLANHAAFSAARTASVYGIDSTARSHLAAAMTMSPISSGTTDNAGGTLTAFGLPAPYQTVQTLCNVPGFAGDSSAWLTRLAVAYLRTGTPTCAIGAIEGRTRRHVVVNTTYIYRCFFFPFGFFWNQAELDNYISYLETLPEPIPGFAGFLDSNRRWNVPIRGRAVLEYWAE